MVDTHCHVYLKQFEGDLETTEHLAREAGVTALYLPNVDLETAPALLATYRRNRQFYKPMMGLHPCSVDAEWESTLEQIYAILLENEADYVAIGEIGLDLYWDKTTLNFQIDALLVQLQWAKNRHWPVAIHCRDAWHELLDVLEQQAHPNLSGVLHCFTGNAQQAQKAIELGYYLGIGGVVTYKNGGLAQSLQNVPLNRLLLETDSPYLAPVPHRGKRNQPAYLPIINAQLAQIMGVSASEMAEITTQNAHTLFKHAAGPH